MTSIIPRPTTKPPNATLVEIDDEGSCPACDDLLLKLTNSRNRALIRQIAINLEMDIKFSCISVDVKLRDDYTDRRGNLQKAQIRDIPMADFVKFVKSDGFFQDLLSIRNCNAEDFTSLLQDLREMKKMFSGEALSTTTLEGRPVTADFCRTLTQQYIVSANGYAFNQQVDLMACARGSEDSLLKSYF